MGHRHRRRPLCGLAVDFGVMAVAYCALVAPQPDSADREAAIPMAFGDARFLEQLDGIPAGADKDEFGCHCVALPRVGVLDTHPPSAVVLTVQIHDTMLVMHRNAGLGGKMLHQQVGQRAVVDIRAGDNARCRKRLLVPAAVHDQRRPFGDLGAILAVLHSVVAMARGHRLEALAQEGNVVPTPDKAHMRARMDESARVRDRAFADQVGPQLARQIELGVDLERLGDVDAPVFALRRVVQLAISRMAGTRIVPGLRTLQPAILERLEDRNSERGFELLEHGAKGGAHDAGADQDDVGCIRILALVHKRPSPFDQLGDDDELATNGTSAPGLSITYARRQGFSSTSFQLCPVPAVSSASRMSPGCSMKCSPVRVWKSSVPLSVMTNWRAGASCHSKAPPALVSRNEMLTTPTVPLRMSPRSPLGRSITPSSK